MRSLLELMDAHAKLHERFAVHRDHVVGLEFSRALDTLNEFEWELRGHMEAEEKFILPLYEKRVGHVAGGDPRFFYLEHRNILRNLDRAKEGLRRLAAGPGSGRREAHEFLQEESLLYQLLTHHDLREKNILYPRLTEALSAAEIEELLSKCGSSMSRR